MKFFESHFWYNKRQRNGILILISIITAFQLLLYLTEEYFPQNQSETIESLSDNKQLERWRAELDSLSKLGEVVNTRRIYPFNPNYLTDYRGYLLGLSVVEIDRLFAFRAKGKFLSSAEEFQRITQISDSLLITIAPFFKFPDYKGANGTWAQSRSGSKKDNIPTALSVDKTTVEKGEKIHLKKQNLNLASETELRSIRGVGEKLAKRIVRYRDLLGGYSINDQLYEVYHLPHQTAERILQRFEVKESPVINKLNINEVSFKELLHLPYIDYELTKKIVRYRQANKGFTDLSELKKIDSFPLNKYERIALYLLAE